MNLFIIVFLAMLTLVALMAIGVICGRKPIAGTCGGLNRLGEGGVCELCGKRPESCPREGIAPSIAPGIGDGRSSRDVVEH